MKRLAPTLILFAGLFATTAVAAQETPFDPRDYQAQVLGEPTQILILGTAHLSGTPADWDPDVLTPLIDRLAAFRPDVIATEDQSGPAIRNLWEYRAILPEAAATYGGRAMQMALVAGLSLDMDMPQAEAAYRERLDSWPADPTPADRRHLAALFAAAGDPNSALVQWWRLAEAERVAGDGVSKALLAQFDEWGQRRNETVVIAARLAARLGLERLYPVDSQNDEGLTPSQAEVFATDVFPPMAERVRTDPQLQDRGSTARMTDGASTLEEYRKLNSAAINRRASDLEWLGVMDRPIQDDVGRRRVAGWEVRNLRLAANLREASARAPGGRVLMIVGAAHKLWIEAYMGMMSDVTIVSTDEVLR